MIRFERDRPNELWQMDFKGHFAHDAGRCHPLTLLDDHSRFSLCLEACANQRGATVEASLVPTFERYGLPRRMVFDNGSPWGNGPGDPYTPLGVWLLRLGIAISHSRPYHPQTLGKDERFHRSLKASAPGPSLPRPRSLSPGLRGLASCLQPRAAPRGPRHGRARQPLPAQPARIRVVGSPKHAAYAGLDPIALRAGGRAAAGVRPGWFLAGIFGQALWPRAGYRRTCAALARALATMGGRARVVYRPHPKESPEDAVAALGVFRAAGLDLAAPPWRSTEQGLCACDLVITSYSTCGYDQMHLNRLAPVPLGVVVYVPFDPEIRSLASAAGGAPTPPLGGGLGVLVEAEAALAPALQAALTEPARGTAWRAARTRLAAPECAPAIILGTIAEDLLGSTARGAGRRAAGSR